MEGRALDGLAVEGDRDVVDTSVVGLVVDRVSAITVVLTNE